MPPQVQELLLALVSLLLATLASGVLLAWSWLLLRLARGKALLPTTPFVQLSTARWGLGTILVVLLAYVVSSKVAGEACGWLGIDLRGATTQVGVEEPIVPTISGEPRAKETRVDRGESADAMVRTLTEIVHRREDDGVRARDLIFYNACCNLIFLAVFPWAFRRSSGADLIELGLTPSSWDRQVQVGLVAGLLVTPVVYTVQFVSLLAFQFNQHPVQQMLTGRLDAATAFLAILSAVVLAPLAEEVFFRGVLQGALSNGCSLLQSRFLKASSHSPNSSTDAASTSNSAGDPDPPAPDAGSETADLGSNPVNWPAIVITSLLFAAIHGPQWPAPIALFVFSICLGTVYQKTGSLLAAVTIHSLFNAFSTLMMLEQQLLPDPLKGREDAAQSPASCLLDAGFWIAGILI